MAIKIIINTIILIFIFFQSGCNSLASTNIKSSEDILNSVEKKYEQILEYHDIGRTITDFGIVIRFETFFKRNDGNKLFLYKFIKKDLFLNSISEKWLYSNQDGVFGRDCSSKTTKDKEYADIGDGIADNFIDSRGHLRLIPSLFYDNLGLTALTSIRHSKNLGLEEIDGKYYFHIFLPKKKDSSNGIHLWIEKDTFMIKKSERVYNNTIITYDYDKIETTNIPNSVFYPKKP